MPTWPLVIRKEQLAALQQDCDTRWYDSRLAELYPSFAEAAAAERRERIRQGIRRAIRCGLQRPDFLQFLCFEQTFSPGCLDEPDFEWARDILTGPGETSADRVKRLRHETIRRLLEIEDLDERAARQADDDPDTEEGEESDSGEVTP